MGNTISVSRMKSNIRHSEKNIDLSNKNVTISKGGIRTSNNNYSSNLDMSSNASRLSRSYNSINRDKSIKTGNNPYTTSSNSGLVKKMGSGVEGVASSQADDDDDAKQAKEIVDKTRGVARAPSEAKKNVDEAVEICKKITRKIEHKKENFIKDSLKTKGRKGNIRTFRQGGGIKTKKILNIAKKMTPEKLLKKIRKAQKCAQMLVRVVRAIVQVIKFAVTFPEISIPIGAGVLALFVVCFTIAAVSGAGGKGGGDILSVTKPKFSYEAKEAFPKEVEEYRENVKAVLKENGLDESYTELVLAIIDNEIIKENETNSNSGDKNYSVENTSDILGCNRWTADTNLSNIEMDKESSIRYGIEHLKECIILVELLKQTDETKPNIILDDKIIIQSYEYGKEFIQMIANKVLEDESNKGKEEINIQWSDSFAEEYEKKEKEEHSNKKEYDRKFAENILAKLKPK